MLIYLNLVEILFTTKPILLPLSNNLTKYCYVCQKRCHNLMPCKKCAHVSSVMLKLNAGTDYLCYYMLNYFQRLLSNVMLGGG